MNLDPYDIWLKTTIEKVMVTQPKDGFVLLGIWLNPGIGYWSPSNLDASIVKGSFALPRHIEIPLLHDPAMLGELAGPLHDWMTRGATVHLRCRWASDFAGIKHGELEVPIPTSSIPHMENQQ